MVNLNTHFLKVSLNIITVATVFAIVYFTFVTNETASQSYSSSPDDRVKFIPSVSHNHSHDNNVWLIFTKAGERSALRYKFASLIDNLVNVSSIPLAFHIVVDDSSQDVAINVISDLALRTNKSISYALYNITKVAENIDDIVSVLMPYFSSRAGSYYSDALFYISLGLHRIAPEYQQTAIMLDCDLLFKKDIALLFKQFHSFKSTALFGLAPELTPVYRHVLHMYKAKHKTTFGEYYHRKNISKQQSHPSGFQGYNSGVILLNLSAIRESKEYVRLLRNETVSSMTKKYQFRGHLGDQDFYTLIGYEYPHLIQTINCGFNRQLCTWWRDHGYKDVFEQYFKCEHEIVVLHGNCKTKIPK